MDGGKRHSEDPQGAERTGKERETSRKRKRFGNEEEGEKKGSFGGR